MIIQPESPTSHDVVALLETHLEFSRAASPPEHVHALDLDGLSADDVTFYVGREDGALQGVGALRTLGDHRAEIKSMHTAAAARGRGVARRMLEHLLAAADASGVTWIGLETGTMDEFAPARQLYASVGFVECDPFDDYTSNPYSVCMSLDLLATS